jgi:ABC-2 type transport system ATP-binding protein
MESVEELCDNIALINKSHLVVTGGTDAIRREYGSNQVEVLYKGHIAAGGKTFVINQQEELRDHSRAVMDVADGCDMKAVLSELVASEAEIISVKKMIPRMNDIFIKLVSDSQK